MTSTLEARIKELEEQLIELENGLRQQSIEEKFSPAAFTKCVEGTPKSWQQAMQNCRYCGCVGSPRYTGCLQCPVWRKLKFMEERKEDGE